MKRKIINKKITFIFCILFSVFYFSCSNMLFENFKTTDNDLNSDNQKQQSDAYGIVCGQITLKGTFPKEIIDLIDFANTDRSSKSVFPSLPVSDTVNYEYVVFAKRTSDGSVITGPGDGKFINADTFEIKGIPFDTEFKIIAQLRQKASPNTVVLEGSSSELMCTEESSVISVTGENKIKLDVLTTGNGKINFTIDIDSNVQPQITKIVTVFPDGSTIDTVTSYDATKGEVEKENIAAGSYDVTFNFYESNGILVYSYCDVINVFAGLTTDTWVLNDDSEGFVYEDTTGEIAVTKAKLSNGLLNQFLKTTFYVNQDASPDGDGSYYFPLTSLKEAFKVIQKYNKSGQLYKIYVKSGYNEVLQETLAIEKNCRIEPYTTTPGDGIGTITLIDSGDLEDCDFVYFGDCRATLKNFIFDGNKNVYSENKGPALITISKTEKETDVTLINCEIKNGTNSGVKCVGGKLTLDGCEIHDCNGTDGGGLNNTGCCKLKNCKIAGCTATNNGGGIYNNGELIFDGICLIGSGDKDPRSNISNYSNSAQNGGGIYALQKFEITDGSMLNVYGNYAQNEGGGIRFALYNVSACITGLDIQCCVAGDSGGGIYAYNEAKIIIVASQINRCNASNGGGVYGAMSDLDCSLKFESCKITECSVTENGGGIYLVSYTSGYLKDTEVSLCSCDENGGGIYMEGPTALFLQDDSVIKENSSTGFGSGVYVYQDDNCISEFSIYGSGYVDKGNEVYLKYDANIELASVLNPPAAANGISAKISLEDYTRTDAILQETGNKYIEKSYFYFDVASDSAGNAYSLDEEGKLISKFYVSYNGSATGTGTESNPYDKITTAISAHSSATKFKLILNGTISDNISISASNKTIYIQGANNDNTKDIIDGNATNRIIENYGTLFLTGITLQNGKAPVEGGGPTQQYSSGGGIKNKGNCTLDRCKIINCSYDTSVTKAQGGAIFSAGTGDNKLVLRNCTIGGSASDKNESIDGGALYIASRVEFEGTNIISYNTASKYGGGIYFAHHFDSNSIIVEDELKCVEISNNSAGQNGGGVYVENIDSHDAKVKFTGGVIKDNSAEGSGSGVYNAGVFSIGKSAYVASDNDIYVAANKTITICSEFELPAEVIKVAQIRPSCPTNEYDLISSALSYTGSELFNLFDFNYDEDSFVIYEGENSVIISPYTKVGTGQTYASINAAINASKYFIEVMSDITTVEVNKTITRKAIVKSTAGQKYSVALPEKNPLFTINSNADVKIKNLVFDGSNNIKPGFGNNVKGCLFQAVDSNIELNNCEVKNCKIYDRKFGASNWTGINGVIYASGGSLKINNCQIHDNNAYVYNADGHTTDNIKGIAICCINSTLSLQNTDIYNNSVKKDSTASTGGNPAVYIEGGGLYLQSVTAVIEGGKISNNGYSGTYCRGRNGGAIFQTGGNVKINCPIEIAGNKIDSSTGTGGIAVTGGGNIELNEAEIDWGESSNKKNSEGSGNYSKYLIKNGYLNGTYYENYKAKYDE